MVVGKLISKIIQSMPTWEVTKYYGRVCIFQLKCLKYRMQTSEAWFNFKCKFMPGSLRDDAECEDPPPEETNKQFNDKSGKLGPHETQKGGTSKNQDYEPTKKAKSRTKMKLVPESFYKDQHQSRSVNKKHRATCDRERSTNNNSCTYKGCDISAVERGCRTAECKVSSNRKKQSSDKQSSCDRQQGQQEGKVICTQPRQEEQYSKKQKLKRSKKNPSTPEKKQKLNRN
ncbi:uncharacterized protein LOC107271452 [Cephus cinctus]|uniref:Uncharacterized protein LOC107271452 n=1 Tax=Cephus cinctus TaxID=211228 RepID=A0AAJ7C7K5_CEPCN|nr:uncharacterized protein LOC107271452 [Cephus cinctus]